VLPWRFVGPGRQVNDGSWLGGVGCQEVQPGLCPISLPPACVTPTITLFAWFISHQLSVLFSQNKPATSNQPTVLFSQNKPAPAISHQSNEHVACMLCRKDFFFAFLHGLVLVNRNAINCPGKIKVFFWRLAHNSIALGMGLERRGVELDTRLVMCGRLNEDGGHLLLKCKHVKRVWQ
jgi:hypothetical protein